MACGAVVFAALPATLDGELRLAMAWDGAAVVYLAQTFFLVLGSPPEEMRARAAREAVSIGSSIATSIAAAAFSLSTVAVVLLSAQGLPERERVARLVVCGATILLSWLTVHTFFAIHYAHRYYDDRDGVPGGPVREGLRFPSEPRPDYWDFVYYAFVIGMTAQVADVDITSREMRRASLVHSLIAFAFNTVILAFAVNIAAGLI